MLLNHIGINLFYMILTSIAVTVCNKQWSNLPFYFD